MLSESELAELKKRLADVDAAESEKRVASGGEVGIKVEGQSPWSKSFRFSEVVVDDTVKIDKVFVMKIPNLREILPDFDKKKKNRVTSNGMELTYANMIGDKEYILYDIIRKPEIAPVARGLIRAGPREFNYFDPKRVRAIIVNCGGLCPGLNNVIYQLVRALYHLYGVDTVYGARNGYGGIFGEPLKLLTVENTEGIQLDGGTMLGSARGGFNMDKIIDSLLVHRINQVYVIGGDGTHRGASALSKECQKRKLCISVCGIPKTIDNDICLVDKTFGFSTAVSEAQKAIVSAQVEATCIPNGIGIVKLMGRHAGFIAAHATLAAGNVDLCLVPEHKVILEGPKGALPHIENALKEKGYAVIVVAEGAGEELLGKSAETDAGGNRKLPKIGIYLREQLTNYFKKKSVEVNVKYIDPSYMIRSVPANTEDAINCMLLAQNAVHGAMAGFTDFTVGLTNNRLVMMPISVLAMNSPRKMHKFGRTWERVLATTRQPEPDASS